MWDHQSLLLFTYRLFAHLMNDNYFTLLKGESKDIEIEFDSDLLPDGNYSLSVIPYNK